MYQPGDQVLTTQGHAGTVVRQVGNTPTASYLVVLADGSTQIRFAEELRLNANVEPLPPAANRWDGEEHRQAERRLGERRGEPATPPSGTEQRSAERRQAERRGVPTKKLD